MLPMTHSIQPTVAEDDTQSIIAHCSAGKAIAILSSEIMGDISLAQVSKGARRKRRQRLAAKALEAASSKETALNNTVHPNEEMSVPEPIPKLPSRAAILVRLGYQLLAPNMIPALVHAVPCAYQTPGRCLY
jgi:hypothetical protein